VSWLCLHSIEKSKRWANERSSYACSQNSCLEQTNISRCDKSRRRKCCHWHPPLFRSFHVIVKTKSTPGVRLHRMPIYETKVAKTRANYIAVPFLRHGNMQRKYNFFLNGISYRLFHFLQKWLILESFKNTNTFLIACYHTGVFLTRRQFKKVKQYTLLVVGQYYIA
jgi:hypothetical protein